jgi:hypothetical protein
VGGVEEAPTGVTVAHADIASAQCAPFQVPAKAVVFGGRGWNQHRVWVSLTFDGSSIIVSRAGGLRGGRRPNGVLLRAPVDGLTVYPVQVLWVGKDRDVHHVGVALRPDNAPTVYLHGTKRLRAAARQQGQSELLRLLASTGTRLEWSEVEVSCRPPGLGVFTLVLIAGVIAFTVILNVVH